ncbi:YheC/YheD family protein [Paenibacillus sp. DMB20]|uniref:YheC/YheD family protein n=1 Tax=Paenibacillus sp. DMB20 TaxID=1642570 RepID=UPI000627BC42|nr:YheC/YheD family protein [Paenibacillus sp. DMB20]KKO52948.1 hypothetical protein XI25_17295 [Paenibacillus sp. DMB20]KKO53572.1 hypothetical protein XI25_11180 [Paenibacillus sp. DMB20]
MAKKPPRSKILKTKIMAASPKLTEHIPLTRRLNRQLLSRMLNQYGMVYVKPDEGAQGKGVIRVEKTKQGYRYQHGMNVPAFADFGSMYASLRRHIRHKRYLVQKGVHLLRYNGRPFDFRVMIQRNPKRQWECTGTFGRLAHPRKAVTNGSQGGSIYEPSVLLAPHAATGEVSTVRRGMNKLAHWTAARLSRTFPQLNELGLDIGLDRRLKPWILEVNFYPDPCPFTLLPNPRAIRTIVAYGKAYGRRYRLKCTKAKRGSLR